jgi:hypothetical protein
MNQITIKADLIEHILNFRIEFRITISYSLLTIHFQTFIQLLDFESRSP